MACQCSSTETVGIELAGSGGHETRGRGREGVQALMDTVHVVDGKPVLTVTEMEDRDIITVFDCWHENSLRRERAARDVTDAGA